MNNEYIGCYEMGCEMLERLTQSLLARVFCGELVSQDAGDESAEILLENI
jgi:hypothetical protein